MNRTPRLRQFALASCFFALMALGHACVPSTARAQDSCSQLGQFLAGYQNLLQQYQQYYNYYSCDSDDSQICDEVNQAISETQQAIAYIQNLMNQQNCGGTGGGGDGDDPCTITRNFIQQAAATSYNKWYGPVENFLNQYYAYFEYGYLHGFVITYLTPPVYCTYTPQNEYTAAARPYYASYDQALRVISQFYNNGYYITNITFY